VNAIAKHARFLVSFVLVGAAASAQAPTFTKDVLPIVQENCVICHRPDGQNIAGMVAPFSLMTYEETRPWAKAIERVVASKEMPPWYASDDTNGHFRNERKLSDEDIDTLVAWVRAGAKRGDLADAPAPVEFEDTGGWIIGRPDLVIQMPNEFLVDDNVEDQYQTFVAEIPANVLPEDRWIRALEWKPDAACVHHIVGFELYTDKNGQRQRQGLGSIAPGEEPPVFPAGYGKRLHAGSKIVFQMHYHKEPGEGTSQVDRSSVGFRFWNDDDPPVRHNMIWSGIVNPQFELGPNEADVLVTADRTFDEPTTVLSLHPHMHLRGKSAKYVAYYPDGSEELLLAVPKWDFDWQLDYTYREPKLIPAGTRIEYSAIFDNSAENPNNPDPSQTVTWGEATTDEMMIGFIHFTSTDPIDNADTTD